jgi:hypothetical protein
VLKAAHRDAMAKTVASGFALDLADEHALRAAWIRMEEHLTMAEMLPALVQSMVDPGIDVAVEVADHPQVGPYLSLRPGGAGAALDRAEDVRVLPLGDLDALRLIDGSRLAAVLAPEARAVLAAMLLRIGALVEEVPEITAIRLNPVIVGDDQAVLTDVEVEVAEVERDPLPPLRRA